MTTIQSIRTKVAAIAIATALVVGLAAPSITNAQSTGYQPRTNAELIAYLYGMIEQLQALLVLSIEADRRNSDDDDDDGIGVPRPGNSSRSDVDVDTLSARDIEEDEAELRGEIDLNGEDEAEVWFEYGEDDDDLDDRTSKRDVDDDDGDVIIFTTTIRGLDEDERYYFRAVAEDEDGDREYGSIRSFTTDDDNNSDDDDDEYFISVSDRSIDAGDEVDVDWEIPREDEGSRNWIGLFEAGDSNRDYIEWKYIDNDNEGTETFEIDDEGDYEFRLFLDDSYDDVAETPEVEVE